MKKLYLLFLGLIAAICLNAQVNVTPPSLTVSTCSTFPTAYFPLGDITITETQPDDISADGSFALTAPSNFEFGPSATITTGGGGLTISGVTLTPTAISFDITVGTSTTNINQIIIQGVTIRGINGPSGPSVLKRGLSGGTDATINGDIAGGAVSHGVLTSIVNVPDANITGNASFCTGSNTVLSSNATTASGTIASYQWNLSGSPIGGATSDTYAATAAGSYTVTVINDVGCSFTSGSFDVTENGLPTPTFTAQAGATTCANTIDVYTTQSAVTNYMWTVPGVLGTDYNIISGGIGTGSNTVTLQWLTTGNKTVTVNYANGFGCSGASPASNTTLVTPGTPPTPEPVSGAITICDNTTGNAYSIDPVTDATGYTWNYSGTGATITGNGTNSITIDFAAGATSGTLSVTADDGCGSSSKSTLGITINAATVITAGPTGAANCQNATATALGVTATGAGTLTYQWFSNTVNNNTTGTAISGATSSSYMPPTTTAGTVYYYVEVTGTCGTVVSATAAETIHNYWTGVTSFDWNVASNWSDNAIPSFAICNTVIIPAGTPNSPQLTSNVTVPNINIASGANLDLNGNTLTITGAYSGMGTLTGSTSSKLIITGAAGTVYFTPNAYPGSVTNNYLHSLVINGSGSVTVGDSLNIDGGTGGNYGNVISTGNLNSNGNLIIKSNANGTAIVAASTGSITGEVTVERYVPPRRAWRFVAVPFSSSSQTMHDSWQEGVNNTDPTLNYANNLNPHPGFGTHITGNNNTALGYDYNTTTNPSVKVWDPSTNAWNVAEPATISTNIAAYNAYCLFVRGSRAVDLALATSAPTDPTVLRIKGVLNQAGGNVTRSLPSVYSGEILFIGNPYAAPIDLANVFSRFNASTNIASNKFWVWNPSDPGTQNVGGYVTWDHGVITPAGDTYPSGTIIQSGQAFMLQAIANGTVSYDFAEGDKVATETNIFGKNAGPGYPLVYVNLTVPQPGAHIIVDGVGTGFDNKFSAAIDVDDADKQWNFDENLATIREGTPLAIEFRPLPKLMDTLFYRMYLRQQPYSLQIFSNNFETVPVRAWLVDKYLNTKTEINLHDTTYYDFTPNPDTNSYRNRFMVVFNRQFTGTPVPVTRAINQESPNTTGVDNSIAVKATGVAMYPNPANTNKVTLEFNNMDKGKYEVTVYSPRGQKVASRKIEHNGGNNIYPLPLNPSWSAGIYTVSIANEDSKKAINLRLVIGK